MLRKNDVGSVFAGLVGKEVVIRPESGTYQAGIVKEVLDNGIVFEITRGVLKDGYIVGNLHFIAYSSGLTFSIKK
jgi:hypothetical protein